MHPAMNTTDTPPFDEQEFLAQLIGLCDDLAWARPADVDKLYALTRPDAGPEHFVRLAEAFGLMLVKLESREYEKERLVARLSAHNKELETARAALAARNALLLHTLQDASRLENVIASSPSMRHVVALALSIARRPINTLILGPTGAGKEVIAKLIHTHSPRSEGPFVAVNCTAIPDSLFESEMFGIEKGVATGVSARKGLVEEAHNGTLFLDELAEMTLPNQAKLLRVIEEREVQRVGSARPGAVDINIIAATHVPLREAVLQGRFREDLYYRINVAEIQLPPLRQRGDDVLLLAQLFLERHCARLGRPRMALSARARRILQEYAWPGNVRELNNEMERAAALTPGEQVDAQDLSPRLREEAGRVGARFAREGDAQAAAQGSPDGLSREGTAPEGGMTPDGGCLRLDVMERRHVLLALERAGGSRRQAAELLGLTREGLRKKLLRLNQPDA